MRYKNTKAGTNLTLKEVKAYWYMIEDCTSSRASIYDTKLNAETKEEAIREARIILEKMSDFDKSKMDDCYIILADTDESGFVDFDSEADFYRLV